MEEKRDNWKDTFFINDETIRITDGGVIGDTCWKHISGYGTGATISISSDLVSFIRAVNIIVPNKVVEVTFWDGEKQKAVCQEPDIFSLETAISICIAKYYAGGTSKYNKIIKQGIKTYEKQLADAEAHKKEEERIAKKRAKREAYYKRRAFKKREEQIAMQAEAYIRALKHINMEDETSK